MSYKSDQFGPNNLTVNSLFLRNEISVQGFMRFLEKKTIQFTLDDGIIVIFAD